MTTSAPTYKVAIGPVMHGKLPYGDPRWPKFNSSFENKDLPQVALAERLYNGHAITTWHRNNWRHGKNYELGQHLGLDFDTEDERSTIDHLASDHFIRDYGAMIYTTPSHTPDAPRARVIFLLDTPIHQPQNYGLAATALLWLFGTADRQCKDPVRFFYGGKPGACEMKWLERELPLDIVKDLIRRYQATGTRERHRRQSNYTPGDADEQQVVDALKFINPWGIAYDDWLSVLMAIHSEFPGANGLQMAESWADGKPHEVEHKWKGFDTGGNTSGRVGIGTLFAMAKEAGWQSR